jgi:CDP-diacylglycerol--serine O-phosphatidyltransferase
MATTWLTISFLFLLCLLVILKTAFFLGFLVVYILIALALNLGWSFGWKGIAPPQASSETVEYEEAEETLE